MMPVIIKRVLLQLLLKLQEIKILTNLFMQKKSTSPVFYPRITLRLTTLQLMQHFYNFPSNVFVSLNIFSYLFVLGRRKKRK